MHNGLPVTVIVSTTLQDLEKGAGLAVTGGGSRVSIPTLIQMAAAGAHHYLDIYDKHTKESLYLGRTKRWASAAQRIALHARERGCTRPGCIVGGYDCQVHHAVADWKNDGHTNIDDLTLGCGPDNRLIEKTGCSTRKNTNGDTEWLPHPTSTPDNAGSTDTTTPTNTSSPKTTKGRENRCYAGDYRLLTKPRS